MILVVDDHADTREALIAILEIEGYQSVAVASGGEALAFLTRYTPRLVILDYSMPDMDGVQVLERMKQDARLAAVHVILFTAVCNDQLRREAVAKGVDAFVVKGSLDWAFLQGEIRRLAGPPATPGRLPDVNSPPAREIG